MSYVLHVELHPLGVVVSNEFRGRELLIEGETCCQLSFAELQHIADTTCTVVIDATRAAKCRLLVGELPVPGLDR